MADIEIISDFDESCGIERISDFDVDETPLCIAVDAPLLWLRMALELVRRDVRFVRDSIVCTSCPAPPARHSDVVEKQLKSAPSRSRFQMYFDNLAAGSDIVETQVATRAEVLDRGMQVPTGLRSAGPWYCRQPGAWTLQDIIL